MVFKIMIDQNEFVQEKVWKAFFLSLIDYLFLSESSESIFSALSTVDG